MGQNIIVIIESIFITILYYFGIINNTPLNNPFAFVVSLGFVMLFSCIVYLTIIFKIDF